jgi:hypothetical protein
MKAKRAKSNKKRNSLMGGIGRVVSGTYNTKANGDGEGGQNGDGSDGEGSGGSNGRRSDDDDDDEPRPAKGYSKMKEVSINQNACCTIS